MLGTLYDNDFTPTIGVEHSLVIDQSNGLYIVGIDLANMAGGDNLELRAYMKLRAGGTRRIASAVITKNGAQTQLIVPSVFGDAIPAPYYFEFTLKQTAGTARVFPVVVTKIG